MYIVPIATNLYKICEGQYASSACMGFTACIMLLKYYQVVVDSHAIKYTTGRDAMHGDQ